MGSNGLSKLNSGVSFLLAIIQSLRSRKLEAYATISDSNFSFDKPLVSTTTIVTLASAFESAVFVAAGLPSASEHFLFTVAKT